MVISTPPRRAEPRADALTAARRSSRRAARAREDGVGRLPRRADRGRRRARRACCASTTREPHEWTDARRRDRCASWPATVAAELERGALAAELRDRARSGSTSGSRRPTSAASTGTCVTDALHWDDRLMELFGYASDDYVPHIDSFSAPPAPRRPRARPRPRSPARSTRCGDYEADYRVVHPDGSVRWVAARGRVLCRPRRPARADARRGLRHDRRSTAPPSASAACWRR